MTPTTTPSPALPAPAQTLVCHPARPCSRALELSATLAAAGTETGPGLLLQYHLRGNMAQLSVPEPIAAPGPADGLWQHTCFEAFVARPDDAAYLEFNFSPSGQWAAYRFSQARVRDLAAETAQPPLVAQMQVTRSPEALALLVWLPCTALPSPAAGQALQMGLTAVVEDRDGQLSYWALKHPAAQPDFHHRGGFALDLSRRLFAPSSASRDIA